MPQQARVRVPNEDWTGIINPIDRRKLQNRLNQRAQSKLTPHFVSIYKTGLRTKQTRKFRCDTTSSHPTSLQLSPTVSHVGPQPVSQDLNIIRNYGLLSILQKNYKLTPPDAIEYMTSFETRALQSYRQGLPNADHLLILSKLNMQRAVSDNIAAMGMTIEWVKDSSTLSIYNSTGPSRSLEAEEALPPSLRPTFIQRTTKHHPWFDVLPFPKIRDNLIMARGSFNERELCRDLMACWDTRNTGAMLLVWGQPWDPMNWEATELFVQKWCWVLRGCPELMVSTNRWREERGEEALQVSPFCNI
ncbi:hypothetical protein ASPCADRAFT_166599 [Aspergillus carbonarius ITEM 5010]|uniref:Uncharacterized protein n=1 Tax=Aspergillus carbonarius (strain ITEM 5010) TaxID=602072 RepID=A0A1R3RT10_ASPC5|nr:hypothetical protein ASPCADRAFT_166599 [Aspergillus carbonarius ITEM 5010]